MKSLLAGVLGLICAAALPVAAFGQERSGGARNQALEDQIRTYEVRTGSVSAPSQNVSLPKDGEQKRKRVR